MFLYCSHSAKFNKILFFLHSLCLTALGISIHLSVYSFAYSLYILYAIHIIFHGIPLIFFPMAVLPLSDSVSYPLSSLSHVKTILNALFVIYMFFFYCPVNFHFFSLPHSMNNYEGPNFDWQIIIITINLSVKFATFQESLYKMYMFQNNPFFCE